MRPRLAWFFLLILALFLTMAQNLANAGDWYVVPQLDLGATCDSNINFNFDRQESDFIFNVSPAVDLKYDSDNSKFTGSLVLKGQAYHQPVLSSFRSA
jgi:hypothetical protein